MQKEKRPIEEEPDAESGGPEDSESYYYDDAHGYEDYDPAKSEEDENEED